MQYEYSVTNNGKAATFDTFSYNSNTYWPSDKFILASDIDTSVKTADITLADGSTVTANVVYNTRKA